MSRYPSDIHCTLGPSVFHIYLLPAIQKCTRMIYLAKLSTCLCLCSHASQIEFKYWFSRSYGPLIVWKITSFMHFSPICIDIHVLGWYLVCVYDFVLMHVRSGSTLSKFLYPDESMGLFATQYRLNRLS